MPPLPLQSVLFFRVYREVTVPLYANMVAQICASSNLPLELATILEDIGQEFIGFAAALNEELQRRGVLADVADAEHTVEARIDALVEAITSPSSSGRPEAGDQAKSFLSETSTRQALKAALAMVWDLPAAQRFAASEPIRVVAGRGP